MSAQRRDHIGATRGKLALVGVLGLVLVYVVWSNFGGTGEQLALVDPATEGVPEQAAPPAIAAPGSAAQPSAAKPNDGPFGEFSADADWPQFDLAKLVEFDPLAPPLWMNVVEEVEEEVAATDESPDRSLEELQNAENAIIFMTGNERVARIGSEEFRVGDMVGNYKITDISSAGIVLSEPDTDAGDSN
jgi:hypothetical protein